MLEQRSVSGIPTQEEIVSKVDSELEKVLYAFEYRGIDEASPVRIHFREAFVLTPALQRGIAKQIAELTGVDTFRKIPLSISQVELELKSSQIRHIANSDSVVRISQATPREDS